MYSFWLNFQALNVIGTNNRRKKKREFSRETHGPGSRTWDTPISPYLCPLEEVSFEERMH